MSRFFLDPSLAPTRASAVAAEARLRLAREGHARRLAASKARSANETIDMAALYKQLFTKSLPRAEKFRRYIGGDVSMDLIQETLQLADVGIMTPIADLMRECLTLDPHANGLAGKRFGSIATLDYTIDPPNDPDLNPKIAQEITAMVRAKVARILGFRQSLLDLAWSLFDGRGAVETLWSKATSGRFPWSPVSLDWIHPRRLGIGPDRELRVINTFTSGQGWWTENGAALDDFGGKFLQSKPRRFGDYIEREGLGRRSMYWMFFKRFSARMRMILHELFAIPPRVIEFGPDTADNVTGGDDLADAEEKAESLGESSAMAVKNAEVKFAFQPQNTGEIFHMTNVEVNDEHSKLWLGNTQTTDAKPDALGGGSAQVGKGEQNIFLELDAIDLSAVFQRDLVEKIVLFNCGPSFLPYAPHITLRAKTDVDRAAEQARRDKAITIGVPVGVDDYYEAAGVPRPDKDQDRFVKVAGPMDPATGSPGAWQVQIVGPGAEELTGEEDAMRGGQGDALPAGQAPAAKSSGPALPAPRPSPMRLPAPEEASAGAAPPEGPVVPKAKLPQSPADALRSFLGIGAEHTHGNDCIELGSSPHPVVNGSPDHLSTKGAKDGARITMTWAAAFLDAMPEEDDDAAPTEAQIHRKLSAVAADLSLDKMARALELTILRSLMLGALDSAWEVEADRPLEVAAYSGDEHGASGALQLSAVSAAELVIPNFTIKPFQEAVSSFMSKKVLSRRMFDRLSAEAKRRSFTVAGLARSDMLKVAHEELGRSILDGADLRSFRSALGARFESAGWTMLNKSHVETIFRNATAGAYASGRHAQMTQPAVLAARPYWQILGVKDSRTRLPHKAAIGRVLLATDPFWARASLPWGHNCRCRKISRSEADIKRLGLTVSTGSDLAGLPDDGWENQSVLTSRSTWDFSDVVLLELRAEAAGA